MDFVKIVRKNSENGKYIYLSGNLNSKVFNYREDTFNTFKKYKNINLVLTAFGVVKSILHELLNEESKKSEIELLNSKLKDIILAGSVREEYMEVLLTLLNECFCVVFDGKTFVNAREYLDTLEVDENILEDITDRLWLDANEELDEDSWLEYDRMYNALRRRERYIKRMFKQRLIELNKGKWYWYFGTYGESKHIVCTNMDKYYSCELTRVLEDFNLSNIEFGTNFENMQLVGFVVSALTLSRFYVGTHFNGLRGEGTGAFLENFEVLAACRCTEGYIDTDSLAKVDFENLL